MKKGFTLFVLVLCMLLLVGCGNNKEDEQSNNNGGNNNEESNKKVVECVNTTKNTVDNYEIVSTYKVYYTTDYVEKIVTTKEISSSEESVLDFQKQSYDNSYNNMKRLYGGYTFTSSSANGKVKYDIIIDCLTIKMSDLANDYTRIKPYLDDNNHLSVEGVTEIYKSLGASCK